MCSLFIHMFPYWHTTLFSEPEFSGEQEMLSQSMKMNVLGRPRNKPVPIPTVIKGGKPGAIPNAKVIEEIAATLLIYKLTDFELYYSLLNFMLS